MAQGPHTQFKRKNGQLGPTSDDSLQLETIRIVLYQLVTIRTSSDSSGQLCTIRSSSDRYRTIRSNSKRCGDVRRRSFRYSILVEPLSHTRNALEAGPDVPPVPTVLVGISVQLPDDVSDAVTTKTIRGVAANFCASSLSVSLLSEPQP
jgi:hypothetical protein